MRKIFSLFAALTLSVGLWAANSVITFTSTSKLYPGSINELMMDNSKWEAFKVQYPEFASVMMPMELEMMGVSFFNPNAFLDADGQVLNYTIDYDESTHAGTITFAGELVTMYGNDNTGVYAFYKCTALTSITLPEGLTSIGEYAFRGCSSLPSVTFPESLTTIATVAFANCTSLTSITIPANVTEIGYGAFISCSGLTDFYVAWTITLPTIEENLFLYASIGTATLHVPTGTTATYAAADQWKDFGSIVEPAPTPVPTTYLDENGVEQNIDAWEVKDASAAVTWGTAGDTTWFVVKGTNVQLSKGAVCAGDVRLILADNAKLTATGDNWATGIEVSGLSNSLTIYGQTSQSGQLIATGGAGGGAGIGGGDGTVGRNITINGGIITATGRGEAAGIGGGKKGNAINIVINGGSVTAIGGDNAAGIGSGEDASASDIYISDAYILKAGAEAAPTTVIAHSSATDMGSLLNDNAKKYVKIEGLATPYTRTVTANSWGTVCLPYAATSFEGADFYKINYYNESEQALYVESVETLEAGKPYIFQATATTVTINHSATAPMDYSEAGVLNNLYGSFARTTIAYDAEHKYAAIANDKVNVLEEGVNFVVPACRAYIDMKDVPTTEQPHAAPLRRMGGARPMPTDLETVHGSQCTMHDGKYIINGQFVIVKDGKTYNAQGTLVD